MKLNEDKSDQRMRDMIRKMSGQGVCMKESIDLEEDIKKEKLRENHVNDQFNRFKEINLYTENNTNYSVGQGHTVSSITDTENSAGFTAYGDDSASRPAVNTGITAKEALDIAIKRVMSSGAPVNNISFYDEINWNLENMGYPSKLPLDIKNTVNDMIHGGEIKG